VQETLDHPSDSDYFGFQALGGVVQVVLGGNSANLDSHLEIWDPTGALISDTFCDAAPFPCVTSKTFTATVGGLYKVGVTDAGFDNTGNYSLGVSCLAGGCVPEPSSYTLMLGGLSVLGFAVSRRRYRDL
jgi:hypothetical protein